jgi:hypothetical protein
MSKQPSGNERTNFIILPHRLQWRLKNWIWRSWFFAASSELKVPKLRRLPVSASRFRE